MTITTAFDNDKLTVTPVGRIDTITAPELDAVIRDNTDKINDLVLDFAGVEYISSAGLRVLLAAQKAMAKKGTMKLIHVNETVMEVLDITGFNDILTVE